MTMKGILVAGLMAATALGATAPAYAQRGEDGNGWRNRGNGGEMRAQRQEQRQEQRAMRQEQRNDTRNVPATVAPQQRDAARTDGRWGQERQDRSFRNGNEIRQPQVAQQQSAPQRPDRNWQGNRGWDGNRDGVRDARDGNRNWDGRGVNGQDRRDVRNRDWNRDGRPEFRQNDRDGRRDGIGRDGINRGYTDQRNWNGGNRAYAGRDRLDNRQRWSNQRRWDNGWRNDRRYDWQSYRRNYGQIYRPGRYYAPRGWNYGYRQFSVGIFLDSMLYSNNYWLNDPYRYRLPPAYGSLRWVRYYDDAMLVDTRDGYVVDVINGFFY